MLGWSPSRLIPTAHSKPVLLMSNAVTRLLEVQSALREKLAQSEELYGELEMTHSQASAKERSLQCKIEGLEKVVKLVV